VSNAGAWRGGEDSMAAGGRLDFLKQRCGCGIAGAAGEGATDGGNAEALGFGICLYRYAIGPCSCGLMGQK
jgi:hypothetical protein